MARRSSQHLPLPRVLAQILHALRLSLCHSEMFVSWLWVCYLWWYQPHGELEMVWGLQHVA